MSDFEETVDLSLEAAKILKEEGNLDDDATGIKSEVLLPADDTDEVPAHTAVEAHDETAEVGGAVFDEPIVAEEQEEGDDTEDEIGEGDSINTRYGKGLITALAVHPEGMQVRLVITALIDITAHELSKKLSE